MQWRHASSLHVYDWHAALAPCSVQPARAAATHNKIQYSLHPCAACLPASPTPLQTCFTNRDLATELLEELNSETTTAVESLVAMEMSGTLFAVSRREFSRASSQHLEGLRMLLAANLSGASAVPTVSSPAGSNTGGSTPPRSPAAGAGAADHGMGGGGGGYSPNPTQMSLVGAHGQVHTGLYDAALASQGIVLPPIPATATGTPELLSMMAAALTYYALACRRLSDTVSMSIMHHLVTAFTTRFRWVQRYVCRIVSMCWDVHMSCMCKAAFQNSLPHMCAHSKAPDLMMLCFAVCCICI